MAATVSETSVNHKDMKCKLDWVSMRHQDHGAVQRLPDVMIKVKMKFVRKLSGMTAKRKATVE